jgi:hypothetical protein
MSGTKTIDGGRFRLDHEFMLEEELGVSSPADHDHKTFQNNLKTRIRARKDALPLLLENAKLGINRHAQTAADKCEEDIVQLENTQRGTRTSDRSMGTVMASSGKRTVQYDRYSPKEMEKWTRVHEEDSGVKDLIGDTPRLQWYIDWALIKIRPERAISNHVKKTNRPVALQELSEAGTYAALDPYRAYPVTKFGHTLNWTTGTINKVASRIHLRFDKSSVVSVDLKDKYGTVGMAYGIVSNREDKDFIGPEDSGSVVLLNKHNPTQKAIIVGLGFASCLRTVVSYMIPFDLVVRDMELRTGKTVVRPKYLGVIQGDETYD